MRSWQGFWGAGRRKAAPEGCTGFPDNSIFPNQLDFRQEIGVVISSSLSSLRPMRIHCSSDGHSSDLGVARQYGESWYGCTRQTNATELKEFMCR